VDHGKDGNQGNDPGRALELRRKRLGGVYGEQDYSETEGRDEEGGL
jgi:hypothetical protein